MRFAYEYIKKIIETTSLDAPVISVVVSGGKTTIEVLELQHIAVGRVVSIDGVKYLVESVNYDNATFTVSGEILEPKIITYPEINFVHGTAAMVNAEIQSRKAVGNKSNLDEKQRYPLLWMVEIYSQKTGGKADNFDIESDIKLVLLDDVKSNKFTTDQHYTNVINGQKQLWDWLLSIFTKHKTIVKNENFDISNDIRETAHTNFGRFQNDKGHTTHILDENISGLEIELSNVRFKLNQCKHPFEQMRCIPVTIYQTIMTGGVQIVNLLSDLNGKSVSDSIYFVVENGRFYVGVPDGSTYAIDDDYVTSSSDAAPAAWVWIDIASKSNGFFIADSVAIRNALPENLRRKGHVCSLFTVDKYVLYTYQGDNGAQVNWSNDANWTLLEGGSTSWNDITDKPAGLVIDENYVHTDNNFTNSEKQNLANQSGENTGDQDLSGLQPKIPFVTETNNEYLRDDGTFQVIEMPVGGYANNLYFNEAASDVSGYETLSYTPEVNTTIESWLVNASEGEKVLKSYLYPSQVGVNYLNSGLWSFQFYGKVSAANGVTNLGVQYFRRLVDNSEINLFTLWSDEINNTTDAWIKISMTLPGYNLATTDHMGCRVLARTTHNQNITINYSVGDGYGAWINNPNKIRHSQLRALNEDLTAQHVDSSTVKTTPINADGLALWDSVALKFVKTGLSNLITFLSESFALKSFLQGNYNDSKELTGFVSPELVVVTGNSENRTVTLTGTVSAKWCGNAISEIVSGWTSAAHPADNTKSYFLYFDGTNFIWSENIWEFYHLQICKAIYINNEWVYVREPHGLMQWQVHKELHERIKAYVTKNTGLVTGFVVGSTTAADRRPVVSQVQINDEDLPTILAAITTNSYTRCYLTGSGNGTATFETAQTEIARLSGNQPYYNQFTGGLWQQTLLANNAHTCIWLVGMPMAADSASQKYRLLWMQGQSTGTLTEMTAKTPNDLNIQALKVANEEVCVFSKLIIKYTAANWQIASAVTYYTTSDSGTGVSTSISGLATVAYSGLHPDLINQNSDANYQHIDNNTQKITPIDADRVALYDSVLLKYVYTTLTNLKAFLKTYFDTIYVLATNTSFVTLQRNLTTQTLAFNGGVVYTDASLGHNCELTVTGNFTLQNPTNLTAGTFIYYRFINDGNATQKTIALSSYYKTSGAIALTNALSGTANAVDLVVFKVVSSTRLELYNIINDLR